jgi:hypothetical protein
MGDDASAGEEGLRVLHEQFGLYPQLRNGGRIEKRRLEHRQLNLVGSTTSILGLPGPPRPGRCLQNVRTTVRAEQPADEHALGATGGDRLEDRAPAQHLGQAREARERANQVPHAPRVLPFPPEIVGTPREDGVSGDGRIGDPAALVGLDGLEERRITDLDLEGLHLVGLGYRGDDAVGLGDGTGDLP